MPNPLPQGCGVALVTPFDATGQLDWGALRRLVDHVIAGGIDFIVVLGTTGEASSLSTAEAAEVLRLVHDFTDQRVPLIAGPFGGSSTQHVLELFDRYADELSLPGYVTVMASVPSYVKPSQPGMYQHFLAVVERSPLPVLLYNVPGRTGAHMTPTTTLKLARASERFIGIKDASARMVEGMQLLRDRPSHFRVYSGDDPTALPLMACGADGVISVVANGYPSLFTEMTRATLSGKLVTARRLNRHFIDVHPWLYADGNPAGIKAVLAQLDLCDKRVRLPLVDVSDEVRDALIQQVLMLEAARAPGLV